MLSATMRSAVTQPLRPLARVIAANSLPSRGALVRRGFLVAPSYKLRVAVRGFATATASKTTGRTAAKSATKTKAAPKPQAKATATKAKKTAKAPAKKKKAAAKPKPKPKKPVARKTKEMSPEKKQVVLRRALKKAALLGQEPKSLPATKWVVFMSAALKGKPSSGLNDTRQRIPAIAAEFKSLSPAELEPLEETAAQNKAINAGNFKTWVESHSIAEIQEANIARRRLKRDFNIIPYPIKLVDQRLPKRPASNAYAYFVKAKSSASPHAGGSGLTKELSQDWHALSAAEKRPYQDLAAAEFAKFQKELEKLSI
ncbi:putative hmg box protein [Diaporthe ampelina]|uniref:Putative hmg box protein n=1 Tax=Diaporthe ampelina TaxID=1214573 RepID=A0A0G2HCP1_9PEZI|nr:putative hmg box protein [Diaporthe ampelina]